ncbi:unnamed protein product, partial [Prorocentrum cordatum]
MLMGGYGCHILEGVWETQQIKKQLTSRGRADKRPGAAEPAAQAQAPPAARAPAARAGRRPAAPSEGSATTAPRSVSCDPLPEGGVLLAGAHISLQGTWEQLPEVEAIPDRARSATYNALPDMARLSARLESVSERSQESDSNSED